MGEDHGEKSSSSSSSRNDNNGSKSNKKVSFYKLFLFADRLDVALMIIGSISAIGNGIAQPLMTLIFGQLINSFGSTDSKHVVAEVSKVFLLFILIILPFFDIAPGIVQYLSF